MQVNKIERQPSETLFGAEDNLLKIKGCMNKVNVLGIVGMGGIGKTTLAKAILRETKSTYDASCFVGDLKSKSDCLEIVCYVLSRLKDDSLKPIKLEDAQEQLKELLVEKKILLILDDIRDQNQLDDIVAMDYLQFNSNTKLILTTRNWNAIKTCVSKDGKVNVDSLKEDAALQLFTAHAFRFGDNLQIPTPFDDIRRQILEICNGLPLSLKVVGSFLHGKERLRSWERALQRLKRGRCLDGREENLEELKLWSILRISFDELEEVEKSMFLDIACFFCRDVYPNGLSKVTTLHIWTNNKIAPIQALDMLVHRSLVKLIANYEILEMHDQLRDMGRMIAEKEYARSRIWNANLIPSSGFTSKVFITLNIYDKRFSFLIHCNCKYWV